MKNTLWIAICACFAAAFAAGDTSKLGVDVKKIGGANVSPVSGKTYTLKWIDDFDGTTLNTNNWNHHTANLGNHQIFVRRKENAVVKDGNLHMIVRKEDKQYTGDIEPWHTENDRVTSYYTATELNTNGKQAFKYGRFEMRAKVPCSYSIWSAFWTVGANRGWPWGGEIDIYEAVSGNKDGRYRDAEYHSCLHWADPTVPNNIGWGTNHSIPKGTAKDNPVWNRTDTKLVYGETFQLPSFHDGKGEKLHDKWRVYGMEWNDKTITFYCDDKVYSTMDITHESMREAYHQPHHIILSNSLGGEWAGYPNDRTVLPQEFVIDWIKVWQE